MKKKERKELAENLLCAIKKVISDNKSVLGRKKEKAVKKFTDKIAKKFVKRDDLILKQKIKRVAPIKKITLK